jgi:Ca2+-binding RTX toxin-like protein
MSLNGMESGSAVQIGISQTTILSVNVENAASSQSESLLLQVYSDGNIGSSTFGLITPDLSNLTIEGTENAHTVYLSQVGAISDLATLTVTGDAKMTLIASNASTSYIDEIIVTNTAGLDMYGLLDGSKALVSSGVDITGGSGADNLVGGAGSDKISAGGGDNIIHGSLGVDDFDISAGALDMLIFHSRDQSAFFSGDNVTGFNIFDGIDISEIVSSVSFGGNFAQFNDGLASLSTNHSVGFFDTTNDTLYVDINHDGSLTVAQDMEFHLNGLDTFNSTSLIG